MPLRGVCPRWACFGTSLCHPAYLGDDPLCAALIHLGCTGDFHKDTFVSPDFELVRGQYQPSNKLRHEFAFYSALVECAIKTHPS